jgi:hypothetical protein
MNIIQKCWPDFPKPIIDHIIIPYFDPNYRQQFDWVIRELNIKIWNIRDNEKNGQYFRRKASVKVYKKRFCDRNWHSHKMTEMLNEIKDCYLYACYERSLMKIEKTHAQRMRGTCETVV